jgi:hypothetical protein
MPGFYYRRRALRRCRNQLDLAIHGREAEKLTGVFAAEPALDPSKPRLIAQ